jgi:hypothetical protein
MYGVVRGRASTRQVRLYMVACCELKATEFFDPRIRNALEIAVWCADDPRAEAVAEAVWSELITSPRPQLPQTGPEGELARGISDTQRLLEEWWEGVRYMNVRHAITHAVYLSLREKPGEVFTGGAGNAAEYCALAIDHTDSLLSGVMPEDIDPDGWELDAPITKNNVRDAIAGLLREIFGNPFRPVTVDPAWLRWNDGTVPKIAQGIYEERAFCRLPILHDALLDAGCDNEDILAHCRGDGPHVRGCWVIDLILGKE